MNRIVTKQTFTATFTGRGEFYSGIRSGERVRLTVETILTWKDGAYERSGGQVIDRRQRSSSHLSVQRLDGKSAHLSIRLNEVEDVRPL